MGVEESPDSVMPSLSTTSVGSTTSKSSSVLLKLLIVFENEKNMWFHLSKDYSICSGCLALLMVAISVVTVVEFHSEACEIQ